MPFNFPDTPAVNDLFPAAEGLVYRWNGFVWIVDSGQTPMASARQVVNYDAAGSYVYVKPSGLKELIVEIWGAGGGGGGAPATAASQQSLGGSGAAGGYVRKLFSADDLNASETLVLGAGGAAGAAGAAGGAGVDSTFKTLTAPGGPGGGIVAAGTTFNTVAGTVSPIGTGGNFNGRGGGGSNGAIFNQGSTYFLSTVGGAPFGRSPVSFPVSGLVTHGGAAAVAGAAGAGGTGAINGQSLAAKAGAAGGDAFAIFTETYWDPELISGGGGGGGLVTVSRKVFTTSGTYTKAAGLKFLDVEIVGGGGGGAQSPSTGAGASSSASGGGGGGYCRRMYAAADLAANEVYTVGGGGTGLGGAGGNTSFKSMVAGGGGGGFAVGAGTTFLTGDGGVAGVATGGEINIDGSSGGQAARCFGAAVQAMAGVGGTSHMSGHYQGRSLIASGVQQGAAGKPYGGGGGGGVSSASQLAAGGGAGGVGAIFFTEYF